MMHGGYARIGKTKTRDETSRQPSMLTLAGAMVHPSYGKLEKPLYTFHRHAWQRNVLDIDHIQYAANGWLPLFQYLQGLDEEQQPSWRFKQRSIGQEEEGERRSRGRGRGLRVMWQCRCSW